MLTVHVSWGVGSQLAVPQSKRAASPSLDTIGSSPILRISAARVKSRSPNGGILSQDVTSGLIIWEYVTCLHFWDTACCHAATPWANMRCAVVESLMVLTWIVKPSSRLSSELSLTVEMFGMVAAYWAALQYAPTYCPVHRELNLLYTSCKNVTLLLLAVPTETELFTAR